MCKDIDRIVICIQDFFNWIHLVLFTVHFYILELIIKEVLLKELESSFKRSRSLKSKGVFFMSKRIRSLAIAAAFSGGFFAVDVIQEPQEVHASTTQIDGYTYSAQVVEALNEINKYRTSAGLKPYKIDPFLSKSAESHAKYLVTHVKGSSHDQVSGKSGFTGVSYKDRAKSAGYT